MTKLILLAMVLISFGCSQNPSRMSSYIAVEMASKLRYVHDQRTGICYAVVASRAPSSFSQNGFTITYVPCTKEVQAIINGAE